MDNFPRKENLAHGSMPIISRRRVGIAHPGILAIIYVHYMARSFCVPIKLPKEMAKIAKCLKCLKLRYAIDFIKRKKQGM